MAKFELPSEVFTKELIGGPVEKSIKAAGASVIGQADGKLYLVPPGHIRRIPDFNVRVHTPSYDKHVEALAASIKANGFYRNKPLGGFAAKEGDEHVIFLTDGYSRLAAVEKVIAAGVAIEAVPVVLKNATTTLEDLTVALVQDNEGRPLGSWEKAIIVKRLVGMNVEKTVIAEKLGLTERQVENYITIAAAPAAIRDLIISEKVAATEALKVMKSNPKDAAKILKTAVAEAEKRGKSKATAKDTEAAAETEKRSAEPAAEKGGESEEGTKVKIERKVSKPRGGMVTETIFSNFKAGDVVPFDDEFKIVRLFQRGAWWDYVDAKTKDQVKINRDTKIDIKISFPDPDADKPAEADETTAAAAAPAADADTDGL